jgi:hypothetical protein
MAPRIPQNKHPVLKPSRHAEVGKYHRNDEDIIHRKRELHDVARDKLTCSFLVLPPKQSNGKNHRQDKPARGPGDSLPHANFPCFSMKQPQVKGQKKADANDEPCPMPGLNDLYCKHYLRLLTPPPDER